MYNSNHLSALTYSNGFTLWHYKTKDLAKSVMEVGYFNEASSMLRVGDRLMINFETHSEQVGSVDIAITKNSDGVVTSRQMTLIAQSALDNRAQDKS